MGLRRGLRARDTVGLPRAFQTPGRASGGWSLCPGGGPPPGLSQSPLPPSGADTAARSPRGRGGRGLARGPPHTPVVRAGSLSRACRGKEAAKDSGEHETPMGQRRPLPRGSLPAVGVQRGRGRPGSWRAPGTSSRPGPRVRGMPRLPKAAPGTLRLRHPTLKPLSPARSPQGGGDPCVLQAAQRLRRKAFAFGRLFPRSWGVSCAGLALSWLWPDGTRALPAGPARVPVAFGAWGGLRSLEPAQKDQSTPFPITFPRAPRMPGFVIPYPVNTPAPGLLGGRLDLFPSPARPPCEQALASLRLTQRPPGGTGRGRAAQPPLGPGTQSHPGLPFWRHQVRSASASGRPALFGPLGECHLHPRALGASRGSLQPFLRAVSSPRPRTALGWSWHAWFLPCVWFFFVDRPCSYRRFFSGSLTRAAN